MSGPMGGSHGMYDEAAAQREFEQARLEWLNSGDQPAVPSNGSISPTRSNLPVARRKGSGGRTIPPSVSDRANALLAETRKMEERLAIMRRSIETGAEKKSNATMKPTRMAGRHMATVGGTMKRSDGLAATVKLGTTAASPLTAPTSNKYRHVGSRIDAHNTFLTVKHQVAKEQRELVLQQKREAAEAARVKAEEERRLARLRAGGHTLITYAAPEPTPQWVISREETLPVHPMAATSSLTSSLLRGDATVDRLGARFGAVGIGGRRVQQTAADVMRLKRQGSSGRRPKAGQRADAQASDASSSLSSSSHASATATSTGEGLSFSSLLDGEYDEEANAAAFAQARLDFLRSVEQEREGSTNSESIATSSTTAETGTSVADTTDPTSASIQDAASNHPPPASLPSAPLPSNWWEESDDTGQTIDASTAAVDTTSNESTTTVTASDTSAAAPGSLLSGPSFDEQQSADAFQQARLEWMKETTQYSDRDNNAEAQPSAAPDNSLSSTSSSKDERVSCYNCFKLFFRSQGVGDAESGHAFCTSSCADVAIAEMKVSCSICRRAIKRKDAEKVATSGANSPVSTSWRCNACTASMTHAGKDQENDDISSDLGMDTANLLATDQLFASLQDMQPIVPLSSHNPEYVEPAAATVPSQPAKGMLPPSDVVETPSTSADSSNSTQRNSSSSSSSTSSTAPRSSPPSQPRSRVSSAARTRSGALPAAPPRSRMTSNQPAQPLDALQSHDPFMHAESSPSHAAKDTTDDISAW